MSNWVVLTGPNLNTRMTGPYNSYNTFLAKYTEIYNNCFPLRRIKIKHHKIDKPWLSKGLLRSIKMKNKLYKQYISDPTLANKIYLIKGIKIN